MLQAVLVLFVFMIVAVSLALVALRMMVRHGKWKARRRGAAGPASLASLRRFVLEKKPGDHAKEESERLRKSAQLALARMQIGQIYFVHGTFAGHDPIELLAFLKSLAPGTRTGLGTLLKRFQKAQTDRLMGDLGNFTESYLNTFAGFTQIPCQRLIWSGGNHHAARTLAALIFAQVLSRALRQEEWEGNPLVIGHSHARQAFCAFEHLRQATNCGQEIFRSLRSLGFLKEEDEAALEFLRSQPVHYLTLGGPNRYQWPETICGTLFQILNVRQTVDLSQTDTLPGVFDGLLRTRFGDAIQIWGTACSDGVAGSPRERRLNALLNDVFGQGFSAASLADPDLPLKRFACQGKQILVDFCDESLSNKPNCFQTLFGHGSYTRLVHMEQLLRLYTNHAGRS